MTDAQALALWTRHANRSLHVQGSDQVFPWAMGLGNAKDDLVTSRCDWPKPAAAVSSQSHDGPIAEPDQGVNASMPALAPATLVWANA